MAEIPGNGDGILEEGEKFHGLDESYCQLFDLRYAKLVGSIKKLRSEKGREFWTDQKEKELNSAEIELRHINLARFIRVEFNSRISILRVYTNKKAQITESRGSAYYTNKLRELEAELAEFKSSKLIEFKSSLERLRLFPTRFREQKKGKYFPTFLKD